MREAAHRVAAAAGGVETVEFLGHADGLVEYGVALRRDIACAIWRRSPELVVIGNDCKTWPGGALNMPDHRAVGVTAAPRGVCSRRAHCGARRL